MTFSPVLLPSSVAAGPAAGRAWFIVAVLALGHLLVDATSIYAATRLAANPALSYEQASDILLAYTLLAFATQPVLGWFVDCFRIPAAAATFGAAAALLGALLTAIAPDSALCLAGLGNALFHVGAGSTCLQLARGTAGMPGVYVAPGSLGVLLGTYTGRGDWGGVPALLIACALLALILPFLGRRTGPSHVPDKHLPVPPRYALALLLIFLAVTARSYVSGFISAPWTALPAVWIPLLLAETLAKAAGLLADRFGWILITIPCVLLAAPLAAGYASVPVGAVAAMFLVQSAMPVTLAATSRVLPARPGLAFGLASFAIVLSLAPSRAFHLGPPSPALILAIQLACAGAIAAALVLLRRLPASLPSARAKTSP